MPARVVADPVIRPRALPNAHPVRPPRVAVFTTSYPRFDGDYAGLFVAELVTHVRERGVDVEVVAPGAFRDFGLSAGDGSGLVAGLRRRPWLAPPAFGAMVTALRRAARDADLVHANWLAGALVARMSGKPFVVTLHGSGSAGRFDDLSLAARSPGLVRWALAPARAVICVSEALAEAMHSIGVEHVNVVPSGVDVPAAVVAPDEPPFVLYVGRLADEKGVDVLAEAARDLPLVVVGDGPLRHLFPGALGFLSPAEVHAWYDRASVVVLPSRREGLGNVLLEAMAHGRAVVGSTVGGIPSVIDHGRNGLLVAPEDPSSLCHALELLLGDAQLRDRLGRAGRAAVARRASWDVVTERTLAVYAEALGRPLVAISVPHAA
jgi:glycosyltransferase involved in cell wall biosynthesis